eukprot:8657810-Pyramimonas_sp.AAC.2
MGGGGLPTVPCPLSCNPNTNPNTNPDTNPNTNPDSGCVCSRAQVFVCLDGGLLMALAAEELTPQFCVIPSCCVGLNPRAHGGLGGPGVRRILQLAMHPVEPDVLALSLSDGSVQVVDARVESERAGICEASEAKEAPAPGEKAS